MADFFKLKTVEYDLQKVMSNRGLEAQGRVQRFIDTQVLQLSAPMVPKDQNTLIESGIVNTQIGSGEVKYRTPYARRWYYMPASFQGAPMRGNYWFERMKQQYKEQILKGALNEANKTGE